MPDKPRQPRSTRWARPAAVFALGVAVQLPLFGFFDSQTRGPDTATLCSVELGRFLAAEAVPLSASLGLARTSLCARTPAPTLRVMAMPIPRVEQPPPEAPLPPDDAQVVEAPEPPAPEPLPPVDTKYLSTHDTRTAKETRSERVAPPQRKAPGKVAVRETSPVQSERSQSPDPTVTTQQDAELKLADAASKLPNADRGRKSSKSVVEQGEETRILLPATSDRAALANLQALAGDFTSDDYLPDLERGDSTLLNANRYKHADFFLRVKRAVERHWHPAELYRSRDPTGRVYGVKDRYTVLRVTLGTDGRVKQLATTRNSGLDFMDREAREAFERAQPFTNPPDGLANAKGEIVFEFGFFFEITGGKHRFDWRRL